MDFRLSHSGLKINNCEISIQDGISVPKEDICSGPRINIAYAEDAVHYPYRFWIKNNPYVSR